VYLFCFARFSGVQVAHFKPTEGLNGPPAWVLFGRIEVIMQTLWWTFVSLCVATVIVGLLNPFRARELKFCAWLTAFSLAMFALWCTLHVYAQPMSISGRFCMFRICFAGFLSMLLSFITAIRSMRGTKAAIVFFGSLAVGATHFVGLILSIPVS
jgi:hypothetical protein